MNAHSDLWRLLAALALVPWLQASAAAQELSFTLVEQLVIGDDEEAPAEYIFTFPGRTPRAVSTLRIKGGRTFAYSMQAGSTSPLSEAEEKARVRCSASTACTLTVRTG